MPLYHRRDVEPGDDMFQKSDLSALDFSALEIVEIGMVEKTNQDETALSEAAAAMAMDIDAALGALFEDCSFQTAVTLEKNGDVNAEVTVKGAAQSREVVCPVKIKRWLARIWPKPEENENLF